MVAFGAEALRNLLQARKRVKQPNQRGRCHHRSLLPIHTYTHPHTIYIYTPQSSHQSSPVSKAGSLVMAPYIPHLVPCTCHPLRPAPCFFTLVFWSCQIWRIWQRADSFKADGSGCPLVLWSRKGGWKCKWLCAWPALGPTRETIEDEACVYYIYIYIYTNIHMDRHSFEISTSKVVLVLVCHLRLHIWSVPPGVLVGKLGGNTAVLYNAEGHEYIRWPCPQVGDHGSWNRYYNHAATLGTVDDRFWLTLLVGGYKGLSNRPLHFSLKNIIATNPKSIGLWLLSEI